MEVNFFQAECGDAASIRFLGDDHKYHNIFIDSGYSRTFRYALEDAINAIIDKGEKIDLWIISHIHDDHIGGIVKYIDTIVNGEYEDIVDQFLYNPPRENQLVTKPAKDISSVMSIDQGDFLYNYLKSLNKLQKFDIVSSTNSMNLYGLSITVLSPNIDKLGKLRKKYKSGQKALEKEEDEMISMAVARKENDYHLKLEDFDLKKWKEDDSVENGSSISLLTEFENKKILWLADAHPNDVANSLERMGYSETNRVDCNWVKVTHHGSKGNNSDRLFSMINCQNYLFSVNGENKHKLPDKECIARLLRNKNRDILKQRYELYFTYDNPTLRSIFENDEKGYSKFNFEPIFSKQKSISICPII